MDLKTNRGVIFKNTKKENDNHPDYKGQIDCDGKVYDIALWLSESKSGLKYFSSAQSEPYVKPESSEQKDEEPGSDDQGLPF